MKIWTQMLFLGASTTLFSGCATLSKLSSNYDACMADPASVTQMQSVSTTTTGVAGIVSNAFASPISIPITALVGLLSTLMAGVYLGSKKNKEVLK